MLQHRPSTFRGLTPIEVLLLLTLVAVLAGIAVPIYEYYAIRQSYAEIVDVSGKFKLGVVECFQSQGLLKVCNGGSNYIPANITQPTGGVAAVTTSAGVITITPVAQNGIMATDTYVLIPTAIGKTLTWTVTGGGVANNLTQ